MKIYLLYTGGTIGCVGTPLSPMQGPQFKAAFQSNVESIITNQIPGSSITYDWFANTLDSTNMQPADWVTIAQKIVSNYASYDGFLILHGTDTMAFTSSALSFLLPGLSKPVFVTGSQLPLFYQYGTNYSLLYNTDALRNVLGAIEFMTFGIPEVGLYFDDNLYRGNRAVKSNASQFAAFSSPNFPPLGLYGVLPKLNDELILPQPTSAVALDNNLGPVTQQLTNIANNINSQSVIQFLFFPAYYNASGNSLAVAMLNLLFQGLKPPPPPPPGPPLKGIVFESFGEGNIPDFPQMQTLLKSFNDKGMIMIDCTQVYAGDVNYNAYATGAWLKGAGVLSGVDMTPIAALTKLVVLIAANPSTPLATIKTLVGTNLAGELNFYYGLSGYQNEYLSPGESLYSINGNYQFINDNSGNLTLLNVSVSPAQQLWQQKCGAPGRLVMQADCNLVFYTKAFQPVWASGTQRIGTNATFTVGNSGSLTINDLYTGQVIKTIYS
jgi:L-asparaginase